MYHSTEIGDGLPVSAPEQDQKVIEKLIQEYEALERACDAMIARQEELARALYRVLPDGSQKVAVEAGDTFPGPEQREFQSPGCALGSAFASIGPAEFQKRAALGRSALPNNTVLGLKRFVLTATPDVLAEIDACEEQIQAAQLKMHEISNQILDESPVGTSDAVAKLRFISALLIDGAEMEYDYCGFEIEECANAILADHVRATEIPKVSSI